MPSGLQEWIYKLEEGDGKSYVKFAAVLLGLFALLVVYDLRAYKNFHSREAMDAAQVARNLSQGKGFTTQFIRPFSYYLLQQHRQEKQLGNGTSILMEPHPDLANPPVYPVVLAGLMKVLPFDYEIPAQSWNRRYQPEILIALFNQGLFLIAIFMTFRVARRLFDSSVAWISAILMAGTLLFWQFTVSGLSTMLLLVLFLGMVWCLVSLEQNAREGQRGPAWFFLMAALVGILLGLGTLTRYSFGWFILPVAGFVLLFSGGKRIQNALIVAALFVLVVTPWLVRNHQVSGTLFGIPGYAIHEGTELFPGNRMERMMNRDFEVAMSQLTLNDYIRKFAVNGAEIIRHDLPALGGNWVSAFFLVGLLVPFVNPALGRLRLFLLFTLVLAVVIQALGRTHLSASSPVVNSENLLILLAPLLFVYGVAFFLMLLDRIEFPFPQLRFFAVSAFVLIMSVPLGLSLLPPRSDSLAYPPYYPPLIQETAGWMKPGELMMSDMPWAVAWYGERNCILVTLDAPRSRAAGSGSNDFYAINDYQKRIQGLYLTPLTMEARLLSEILKGPDWDWGRFVLDSLLRTNVPVGFELKFAPRGYLPEQLFLTDHPRWKNRSKED
jgi:hypothetical protein